MPSNRALVHYVKVVFSVTGYSNPGKEKSTAGESGNTFKRVTKGGKSFFELLALHFFKLFKNA